MPCWAPGEPAVDAISALSSKAVAGPCEPGLAARSRESSESVSDSASDSVSDSVSDSDSVSVPVSVSASAAASDSEASKAPTTPAEPAASAAEPFFRTVARDVAAAVLTELAVGVVFALAWWVTKGPWLPWGIWAYLLGVGVMVGGVFAVAEQLGARGWPKLGVLAGLLLTPGVLWGGRFLVEWVLLLDPLKAYVSLAGSLSLAEWPQLVLVLGAALLGYGSLLVARWRDWGPAAQTYAMLAGTAAWALCAAGSPLRFEALNATFYLLPLLVRAAAFPLLLWGLERLRARLSGEVERAARGSGSRALDPRARHRARWGERQGARLAAEGKLLEAAQALAQAAEAWPSAERSLQAALAFARADEPYVCVEHLHRMLDDPAHDPRDLDRPELGFLRELEVWGELEARRRAKRALPVARRPPLPWRYHVVAACALAVAGGWTLSFAWTREVPAQLARRAMWARLRGDGDALVAVARALERGTATPPATVLAESAFFPGALLRLGVPAAGGQSLVAAERVYIQAARAGSVPAMLRVVGLLEDQGPRTERAQSHWLERAAAAGSLEAQWRFAARLRIGQGIEPDPARAYALCRAAAEAGAAPAMMLLAEWLEIGSDAPPDPAGAARWYRAAAAAGEPHATVELQRLLRRYPELGR